ncbi:DUF1987 domain-containing protein [Clostridium magnum]|uniref:SiaC family regulatory phosphoprotein domain-containing protein n=1 Tax=Clostridium magnum DSM 2767 TaxID=1121326 RepID=A0A161WZA7_9CLOT|nr:DUF1987 domain-containing protein [Clostridium magnum]KZL92468.1 hypothetical protein CLMAG_22770 [Clostridium magnum DSM 2767]SHI26512.1 protein of unknown function [Clostridium magnum DSM 2767]
MDKLYIEETKSSPEVDFNSETGILKIKGQSYPENAFKFYEPLFDWIDDYFEDHNDATQLDLGLIYLNTSSIKCLMDIIYKFEESAQKGKKIRINWYYKSSNRNILECGKELEEDLDAELEFNFIEET